MGYYLEEHPNPTTPQYGWPRTKASGVIGVHTTESGVVFSGADPGAENTAAFIAGRADYGSYHILADWDTIVPLTRPTYAAWADTTNNVHALSVSGAMDAARWRDLSPERAAQIVRNMGIAAAMLARDAVAHGVLDQVPPAVRITADEAIRGTKAGFYGHGETNPGTRYDPGQNFDWGLFLSTYAAAVGGGITYQGSTTPETGFLMALTDKQQEELYYITCTAEGRKERARQDADELLASNVAMLDGGQPTFAELLAVSNDRLGHIKRGTDLLPALDADLRGEADIVRAHNATLLAAVTALSGSQPNVNTEQVLAAIEAAMDRFTSSHRLTITKEAGE